MEDDPCNLWNSQSLDVNGWLDIEKENEVQLPLWPLPCGCQALYKEMKQTQRKKSKATKASDN